MKAGPTVEKVAPPHLATGLSLKRFVRTKAFHHFIRPNCNSLHHTVKRVSHRILGFSRFEFFSPSQSWQRVLEQAPERRTTSGWRPRSLAQLRVLEQSVYQPDCSRLQSRPSQRLQMSIWMSTVSTRHGPDNTSFRNSQTDTHFAAGAESTKANQEDQVNDNGTESFSQLQNMNTPV